jgi:lysozyme
MNKLLAQLKRHEGFRPLPYTDSTGHLTIGYGTALHEPISQEAATYLLLDRLTTLQTELERAKPQTKTLDIVRQSALLNMAYNLGASGLLKFRRMWAAIEARDWPRAADEALDSRWALQVGSRAIDIAGMLHTGQWPGQDDDR